MPYLELLVDTPKYKAGERAHFSKEAAAALTSVGTARILRSDETTDAEKGIAPAVVSWGIHRGLKREKARREDVKCFSRSDWTEFGPKAVKQSAHSWFVCAGGLPA